MKNNRGFIEFLPFLVVFLLVFVPSIIGVTEYRVALADDIKSGKLINTPKSAEFISKGDELLSLANNHVLTNNSYIGFRMWEGNLFAAFVAKVNYERARLEMEMEKAK
jgi:hypothetical protein